jgi:hypothetical protein
MLQYQKTSVESAVAAFGPAYPFNRFTSMDRRLHERFDLQATAHFSWKDAGGLRWSAHGTTRDISERGLFVVTPDVPPSGTAVRLEVRACSGRGAGLLVQTKGQVVRVEVNEQPASEAGRVGFAVATRSLILRNCKPLAAGRNRGSKGSLGVVRGASPSYTRKPN